MTIEDLKRHCEKIISIYPQGSKTCEEHELVLILSEKQTPQKPILQADGYADGELVYDTWLCPSCDKAYEVDIDKHKYCPNCGQKLDFTEMEGEKNC